MNTLLLVEDDPFQRKSYVDLLRAEFGESLRILETGTLEDAKPLLRSNRNQIAVVILDLDIPEKPDERPHDRPVPVGLKLLLGETWFFPVVIFSAHEVFLTPEVEAEHYIWQMVLKGAPDSTERLLAYVRNAIDLHNATLHEAESQVTRVPSVSAEEATLAVIQFWPTPLRSTSAVLGIQYDCAPAYRQGRASLRAAAAKHGGTIINSFGTLVACLFPATEARPQHFQGALSALKEAYSNIRTDWKAPAAARFSAGLYVGPVLAKAGSLDLFAHTPTEVAAHAASLIEQGRVAVPTGNFTPEWKTQFSRFFDGHIERATISLAPRAGLIPLTVGTLM